MQLLSIFSYFFGMTPNQIDTSLKTSFVAKNQASPLGVPLGRKKRKKTSIFLYLGIFVFLVGVLFSGGVYAFQKLVSQDVAELESRLARAQQVVSLENLTKIELVDAKLKLVGSVYKEHRVLAPLFRFLENNTLPGVRYADFYYDGNGGMVLNGEAESYEVIAQQSDILSSSDLVDTHIFSGFVLSEFGRVSFNLNISPSQEVTHYVKN